MEEIDEDISYTYIIGKIYSLIKILKTNRIAY